MVVLQIVSPRVKFSSGSVGGLDGRSGEAEGKEKWAGIKSEIEHGA